MTIQMLDQIPALRRTALFSEISRLVDEAGAIDRSLERLDEGWAIDDTLEEIVASINEEMRLARKSRRRLATVLRLWDNDNAA